MSELEPQSTESADGAGRPGLPLDPYRLWLIFRNRWQVLVVAGVVGAFAGAAIAKKVVKQNFSARGVVSWEGGGPNATLVQRQTIIESMNVRDNYEQLAKRLKVTMDTDSLRNFVQITTTPTSNTIAVEAVWADPEGAADLVNGLVDIFLTNRSKQMAELGRAEVERARTAVASAERQYRAASEAYERFRAESGISDVSQERQAAIMKAAELSSAADNARAQASYARAELDRLKNGASGADSPAAPAETSSLATADRARIQGDEQRLAAARRELGAAKVQYSADHPNVLRLTAEVESIEKRLGSSEHASASSGARKREALERQEAQAASRQRAAEEYAEQVRQRLSKLSAVEGRAVALLGEQKVAQQALEAARGMSTAITLEKEKPPNEFRVVERAKPPAFATQSGRKKVALVFPIGSIVLAAIGLLIWSLRRADVRTPAEAAFWGNLPVVGASTWPRDPDMLASLMHDLDDYAPRCVGVTLIVGASVEEAHLARRVAEWDGHTGQPFGSVDEQRLLTSGAGADVDGAYRLAVRDGNPSAPPPPSREASNMQILTLTGPVPAQALRRAARLADRVLVVVTSGRHDVFQLMKIRGRLGRDEGIGILLVGLEKDLAMVRDRVGPIERFWYATRSVPRPGAV